MLPEIRDSVAQHAHTGAKGAIDQDMQGSEFKHQRKSSNCINQP